MLQPVVLKLFNPLPPAPKDDANAEKPKKTEKPNHEVLPEPAASSSEKPNDEVLPEPAASSSAAAEVPKIYTQQEIDHFVKQLETMIGWGGKDDFTYITESGEIFCRKDLEEIIRRYGR